MTAPVDIINRALAAIGTRTTVAAGELSVNGTTGTPLSNEAIQASLLYDSTRQILARMAPWAHVVVCDALALVKARAGTTLNTNAWDGNWYQGDPTPPWLYMFQWPTDCLRVLQVIPQLSAPYVNSDFGDDFGGTGAAPAPGTPIFPSGIGVYPSLGLECFEPVKFAVGINRYPPPPNPGTVTGGVAANQGPNYSVDNNRVILCNEPYPLVQYCADDTDPNNMDPMFIEAFVHALAAKLALPLTGDKALVQLRSQTVNELITQARAYAGSEGPVVNDVVPDWMLARGVVSNNIRILPSIEWGPMWRSE